MKSAFDLTMDELDRLARAVPDSLLRDQLLAQSAKARQEHSQAMGELGSRVRPDRPVPSGPTGWMGV